MACFNEQRTGKTPIAITVQYEQGLKKVLIVCPASATYPWADEYTRWTGLPATVLTGEKEKKTEIIKTWKTGALIASYDSIKRTNKSTTDYLTAVIEQKPEGLILDEAHRIQDRTTANAKMAFELAEHIPYRLALTGTPTPNKPHTIWSILHFLYPKKFASYWKFVEEYFYTCMRPAQNGRKFKDIGDLKPYKVKDMHFILSQIATQRKRKDVMDWLPEQEPPTRILLPPTTLQQRYLKELKDYFETEHIITQGVLDRLIRYRQICLHPALLNLKGNSPKLDWVLQYLKDYPDRPTVLFSKFTSFIHLLEKELPENSFRVIVGNTPIKTRNEHIKAFQQKKYPLLLINIDAGKEALTIDRAEALIFTDKFPPAGDIEQATARIVATTPDKADIPKTIYELILKGTYDEQLYDLVLQRAASVDVINNFQKYMKGE